MVPQNYQDVGDERGAQISFSAMNAIYIQTVKQQRNIWEAKNEKNNLFG